MSGSGKLSAQTPGFSESIITVVIQQFMLVIVHSLHMQLIALNITIPDSADLRDAQRKTGIHIICSSQFNFSVINLITLTVRSLFATACAQHALRGRESCRITSVAEISERGILYCP